MSSKQFRPDGLEEARELWWEIFGHAVGLCSSRWSPGAKRRCTRTSLQFLEWTRRDPRLTAERLLDVEIKRDLLKARFLAQMQRYPVLLCPVAPIPAFRHGEREWMVEGRTVHYLDAWRYTAWFNLLQNPAMSVPVSQSADGLPIGVQVVARAVERGAGTGRRARHRSSPGGVGRTTNLPQPLATPRNPAQPHPTRPNPRPTSRDPVSHHPSRRRPRSSRW